jgi:ABC-type transport system involved in Fe-S cluster assembly fused permease/ATPase subunit
MTDVFIFNVAPLLFQLVIVGASLFYFDKASAIVIMIVVVVFVAYGLIINHMQQSATLAVNDAEDFEKANISDIFTNIDSVKYFGKENAIQAKYASINEKVKNAMVRNWN